MRLRRTTWGVGLLGTLALGACGGDDSTPAPAPTSDASSDVSMGNDGATTNDSGAQNEPTSPEGGGADALSLPQLVARGDYLVNHVAACPACHTPRDAMGMPIPTKMLAGSAMAFADIVPDAPDGGGAGIGKVYVRNLTPDMATRLAPWTDAQIKDAFLNGNAT